MRANGHTAVGGVHGQRHAEAAALRRHPEAGRAARRHQRDDRGIQSDRAVEQADAIGPDHAHAGAACRRAQPLLQAGSLERDLAEAARDGKQEADATRGAVLDRVDQTLARRKRDQQVDWLRQRLKRGYRSAPGNVLFAGIDGDQFAAKGRGEAGKDLSPQLVDARRCTEHGNRSRREEAGEIKSDHGVSAQYPRKRFGRSGSSRSVAAGPSMTMAPPLGTQRQSACARAIGTLCSALSSVMPCS